MQLIQCRRGKNKKFGEGGSIVQSLSTSGGLRPPDPPTPNFKENIIVLGVIFMVQGWFIGVRRVVPDHPRSYLFLPLQCRVNKMGPIFIDLA